MIVFSAGEIGVVLLLVFLLGVVVGMLLEC